MALSLLTDGTYSVYDAWARCLPAQYVPAIMQHGIRCNIIDIANQLSFVYQDLGPEFQVFVSPQTESTKAADLIHALEKKQEVWYGMITTLSKTLRYYNSALKTSVYRLSLPSQSKAFSRY